MFKDFFNHIRLVDEADDPHFPLAFGAGQGVCFVDFSDEVGPSLPSDDRCFQNAAGDIWKHRVNNSDWENDWVFYDRRWYIFMRPTSPLLP